MRQFPIEFKIEVAETYINAINNGYKGCTMDGVQITSAIDLIEGMFGGSEEIGKHNIHSWVKLYREGKLALSNAIAVSHKIGVDNSTPNNMTIDGEWYIKYNKPTTININGVDYIKKDTK